MATSGIRFIAAVLCMSLCLLGITALLPGPKCGFPQVKSLLDSSLRIVGGTEALHGSHPWLVSLRSKGLHFCGASILTDRWLLTAAHCLYSVSDDILQNVSAVIGEHDQRVADRGEQMFRLKTIRIHEKYQPISPMNYDIALLEVDGLIQFDEHVQPLCLPLPSEKFPASTSCIVGGWGRIRERGRLPAVLREVMLDLVEPGRCRQALRTLRPRQLPLTVVCAGPDGGGRDACQGDSGSPLICPREDGHWAVVGVTSWGKGCGRSWVDNLLKPPNKRGSPGVFTDVKVFLSWIKRILKETRVKSVSPPRLCHVIDGPLTENQGVINNPDKPANNYANNEICSWSISVAAGSHILLEFLEFDLENDTLCHSDQVTVFGGANRVIGKFCGSHLPEPVLITSSSAAIQFVSDASGTRAGFSIQYKTVAEDFQLAGPGCGTVALFQAQEAIRSPRYPEAYGNNADCRWVIHAPKGHVVKLDFHDFDLEQSEHCQYDSLKILGDIDGKQEIVVLCGGTVPPPVLSYDSMMVLHLISDSSITARGFHAIPTFIKLSDLQEVGSRELEDESDGASTHSRYTQTGLCGMPHSLAGSEQGGLEEGEGTSLQHWPWDARLHLDTEVICLGAIIQPDWILTAAHCVHGLDEEIPALTVETGDPDSQSRRVRKVLVHPQYNSFSLDSDVALLHLDSDIALTNHTQLVCLPTHPQEGSFTLDCKVSLENRRVGTLRNNASQSVEVEHAACEHYYPGRLTDTMLCAEHKELNRYGSCMGHAGAPLVCRTNNSNFFVQGVASWREGCGKFPRPAVYSSVLPVMDWILEQLDATLDSALEEYQDEKDFRTESSEDFY
ncbi:ovochymase-2 isoform X1 [Alosa alosa]|uniref:ovochymase-2 isoform X1 n=1 Tax=Alosa alosa TaxID=278164 RepID=UPI0020152771|nr:ovochymase-2 isoform X1 [Alosa alosa]